jgi:hypothetical protein
MVFCSVVYVVCGVGGAALGGAVGTMRGAAIATWIGAIVFWWHLRAALRESGHLPAGQSFPAIRAAVEQAQAILPRLRWRTTPVPWTEQGSYETWMEQEVAHLQVMIEMRRQALTDQGYPVHALTDSRSFQTTSTPD